MKVTCHACHAVLNSAQELPPGKRIKCSACGAIFAIGDAGVAEKSAPAAQPLHRSSDVHVDEEFERRPARRRSLPPIEKPPTNLAVVLTLCAVGALVFIGIVAAGVVGAVWYFSDRNARDFNDANNPRPVIVTGGGSDLELIIDKLQNGPKKGDVAPEIEGEDFDGKKFKLREFRGKVVLLYFWGDRSPLCVRMFPHLRELVTKYDKKPFVVLGVNTDASKEKGQGLRQRGEINWRSWWDGQLGPIAEEWAVENIPMTYLVDQAGVIQDSIRGAQSAAIYDRAVSRLLKEMEK